MRLSTHDRLVAAETGIGNGQVSAGASEAVTVIADHIYFNFSDPNEDYLKFYGGGGFLGDTVLCFQTFTPFCSRDRARDRH